MRRQFSKVSELSNCLRKLRQYSLGLDMYILEYRLRKLLNDGQPIRIKNFPKKNYKAQESLSFHGFTLYKTPDITKIVSFVTPIEDFFIRNHLKPPIINVNEWQLKLEGLFLKEVNLSLDEIKNYERVTKVHMIECTGNQQAEFSLVRNFKNLFRWINVFSINQLIKLIDPRQLKWWVHFLKSSGIRGGNMLSNGVFTGVRLFDVLEDYPFRKEVKHIVFVGIDRGADTAIQQVKKEPHNYARSWSVEELKKYEPLLCFEMNNKPLTTEMGYPLRLLIPGIYGHEQVKWLGKIVATSVKHTGYFQTEYYGYKIGGETEPVHEMRVKSMMFKVLKKNDKITIIGIAWRGMSPIDRVEVSIDNMETWDSADLLFKEIDNSWLFFQFEIPKTLKGIVKVSSRAFCVNGDCQPLKPGKYSSAYGNNSVFTAVIEL